MADVTTNIMEEVDARPVLMNEGATVAVPEEDTLPFLHIQTPLHSLTEHVLSEVRNLSACLLRAICCHSLHTLLSCSIQLANYILSWERNSLIVLIQALPYEGAAPSHTSRLLCAAALYGRHLSSAMRESTT